MNYSLQPFINKEKCISVTGLGYVGLPLALELSKQFKVIGFDINQERIALMQKGIDPSSLPCVFTVPDISIQKRDLTVDTILTQPICYGDKGTIKLVANNVQPQYYFSISNSSGIVNSVGPILQSDYTFSNLNSGTYTVNVSTDDGCTYTNNVTINQPTLLTATAALTKPLTCTDGEITVYPSGGTPPYYYFVNSTTDFQYVPQITVAAPGGDYTIQVVDSKNCVALKSFLRLCTDWLTDKLAILSKAKVK